MADRVTGVTLTPNPDGTVNIQIGPNGFQIPQTQLFDRVTFDPDHLMGNIRLKNVIGNYGANVWSQEFLDAINANGIQTTSATFYGLGFTFNPDGSLTVTFGTVLGGTPNQSETFNTADLGDTHDLGMVVKNIGAWLRMAAFHDLTTPAPNGLYVGKTAVQVIPTLTFRY